MVCNLWMQESVELTDWGDKTVITEFSMQAWGPQVNLQNRHHTWCHHVIIHDYGHISGRWKWEDPIYPWDLLASWYSLLAQCQASERPRKTGWMFQRDNTWNCLLASTHMLIYVHKQTLLKQLSPQWTSVIKGVYLPLSNVLWHFSIFWIITVGMFQSGFSRGTELIDWIYITLLVLKSLLVRFL